MGTSLTNVVLASIDIEVFERFELDDISHMISYMNFIAWVRASRGTNWGSRYKFS